VSEASIEPSPLYPVSRRHLESLSSELGVWQHASLARPDPAFGFCTDDVARALTVDLLQSRLLGWAAVADSVARHIRFLEDAVGEPGRRFRNFRAADGTWLEGEGSEDSHGRAMLGLADAMSEAADPSIRERAGRLFEVGLACARTLRYHRSTASALLACDRAIGAGGGASAEATFGLLTDRLAQAFGPALESRDWPWPEAALTYENALLPRALIVAGQRTGVASMTSGGFRVLDWLIDAQTSPGGCFSPVGNMGWLPKGGEKSPFDQQPIEAMALLLASEAAIAADGGERFRQAAEMAYGWFLGANDLGVPVAKPLVGACHDGLTPGGLNVNQGAESTIAWLTSLEHMRAIRASGAGPVRGASSTRHSAAASAAPASTAIPAAAVQS
jgi:hypothetical protein